MNNLKLQIPEVAVPGKRLGRHINHDENSARYLVPEAAPSTTTWQRITPILDQGNLGSCTGNAMVGVLGSTVMYESLTADQKKSLDENEAVKVYELATQLDGFPGAYPPDDTGSDGLSAAKAARQLGFCGGFVHATSLAEMYGLIQRGSFAFGGNWHEDQDNPNSEGVVHATGAVRGGHEWEVLNYNASTGLWECVNSWSDSWGKGGHFFIPDEDMNILVKEQGDSTGLTVNVPTPNPTPTPTPQPTNGVQIDFTQGQVDVIQKWASAPHLFHNSTVAAKAWNEAVKGN